MDIYSAKKSLNVKSREKPASSMEFSQETLKEKILQKTKEGAELQDIIQKQLENINELQKKCEESFIVINHLPQSKLIASEKFENAMKLSDFVKKKQIQVSELLNIAMKEFDEITEKTLKLRGQLASDIQLADQRVMIYSSNLNEIKNLCDTIGNSFKNSINNKISQMNWMKDFLESNFEDKMNQQLCELNSQVAHIDSLNSKIEEKLSHVYLAINTIEEKCKTEEEDFINKIKTIEEKLQIMITKYKEGEQELTGIVKELSTLQSNIQEQIEKISALRVQLLEEIDKLNTTKQEILSVHGELDKMKTELENSILECHHLREKVKIVSEFEEEIRVIQEHLSEFEEQKVELLDEQKSFINRIDLSKQEIEKLERNLEDKNSCIENIKMSYNSSLIKVNQLKETDSEEMNSFQKILLEINKDINELQIKNVSINDSFSLKTTKLEEYRNSLTNEREESEGLKNELNDMRESNQNRKTNLSKSLNISKIKYNELREEVDLLDLEFKEKNQIKDEISALAEKIKIQKENLINLFATFEKEKNDLKSSFCDNFEAQLCELQKVKEEQMSALEKVKDNASKAEFMYYRLKRIVQQHSSEKNCVKDTLNSYNCENEMLRMVVHWLSANGGDLVTENKESSPISSSRGSQTTSPIDKELTPEKLTPEELGMDEMLTHIYHTPTQVKAVPEVSKQNTEGLALDEMRTLDYETPTPLKSVPGMSHQESQGEMKVPQLPKRFLKREAIVSTERTSGGHNFWKKPKKDSRKKTILDLVVDSTDSQSSA